MHRVAQAGRRLVAGVVFAAGIAAADPSSGSAGSVTRLAVPEQGTLELDVPTGWTAVTAEDAGSAAVELRIPDGRQGALLVSIQPTGGPLTAPALKTLAGFAAAALAPRSKDEELDLREMEGAPNPTFYFTATDPASSGAEGDFEHSAHVFAAVGGRMIVGTVLQHVADERMVRRAVVVLATARWVPDGGAARPAVSPVRADGASWLPMPGALWGVAVELAGFDVLPVEKWGGRGASFQAKSPERQLFASVIVEPWDGPADPKALRTSFLETRRELPMAMRKVRTEERGEVALLYYLVPKPMGEDVNQANGHALLVHDGAWVDVHVSAITGLAAAPPWGEIEKILATVRIEPASAK
jgi:hypothetical protein